MDFARQLEAYLKRRHRGPMELLSQDIATVRVRAVIREEVMPALRIVDQDNR
jgi:hypothetical protein